MSMLAAVTLLAGEATDAGPLTPVVVAAGWLISATVALGLAWRGRADWEPAEEDLSRGPAKVGGLVCAVILGLLWAFVARDGSRATLGWIAGATASLSVIALVFYSYLINGYVYDKVVSDGPEKSKVVKIVGGFSLTDPAGAKRVERPELTIQDLLKGALYEPDRVWPRPSRGAAKSAFALSYIALTTLGTIALAAIAMLLIR